MFLQHFFTYFLLEIYLMRSYTDIWKSDMTQPIFKNWSKTFIVNYHPISLLTKCLLLFEKLVYRHIYSHVWMKIHPEHFGFQQRKKSGKQLIDNLEYAHSMNTLVTDTVYPRLRKSI